MFKIMLESNEINSEDEMINFIKNTQIIQIMLIIKML
jgi:hypothetical protein